MGIVQRFFSRFQKVLVGRTISVSGAGTRATTWLSRDLESNEIVSAIIDCTATHVSRGQALHIVRDKEGRVSAIKRASEYSRLFQRPNRMMTRQDFMYAMAWQMQLTNLAIAWVNWRGNHPVEIWPTVYTSMEIRERLDGGFAVQFQDMDGKQRTVAIEDLIVIRRKYNGVGYTGQGNSAVGDSLTMVRNLDEGFTQAVQISNKIHGLLKQKKSMLSGDTVLQAQKDFMSRMEDAGKNGGIVALDAMEDYTPLNVSAWTANATQQKQITDRIYTFWRTPLEVVNNTAPEQMMQNYYESVVEPIWEEMAEAFTQALFTQKEQAFGNCILVTSGSATGASWNTKLMLIANTKDLGLLTTNEYRELVGYGPVNDGDERLVSLNYVKSTDQSQYQTGQDDDTPADASEEEPEEEPAEEEPTEDSTEDSEAEAEEESGGDENDANK